MCNGEFLVSDSRLTEGDGNDLIRALVAFVNDLAGGKRRHGAAERVTGQLDSHR